jgi:Arc/MetJ-type ribon-helix-helix transcriptional regulator
VNIQLGPGELALLDQAAAAFGTSRSEVVRRAVRHAYGRGEPQDRLAAIRAAAGIWQDRLFDGATYVEALRDSGRPRRTGLP